jgi:hypothetical protein
LTFLSSAQANAVWNQRVLGDYMQMKAVGNCFYGAFTGNGAPFGRPVANHDPIFFKVCTGPQLQVNESLEVPPTCVGSTSMATLEACNTGLSFLILADIESDNTLFSVTPKTGGFPINISPDACISLEVNFSPAIDGDAGPQTGTLTITSDDPSEPETFVSVSSSASLPDMTATLQADGVFGDVAVGSTKLLNLEVLNQSGICELSVIDLARASGSTDFDFAGLANGLSFPVILQPGANVDLPIKFTPASFDPVSATFDLTTDDPDSPTTFSVNGNSPAPKIAVTGDLSFGQVCADTTSERDVEICNVGLLNPLLDVNATLVGAGCDDFEIVGNPFPADISHDFCIQLTVRYMPTAVGDHNDCDLQITSNDPDVPEINLPLTGSTPAPEIDVAADLTFPATVIQGTGPCSSKRAFPVQNNGMCPLTITGISITDNYEEYSLDALPSFPIILAPGELAGDGDLRVVFSPYDLAYQSEGEITVTYETDSITHDTTEVPRSLCGEGVRTGARVLVTIAGVPIPQVKSIKLHRLVGNRKKDHLVSLDNARNLDLQTVIPASPCTPFQYHREYGTELNPIQLAAGSYTVTVQIKMGKRTKSKTVGFDVSSCDFNPNIIVDF